MEPDVGRRPVVPAEAGTSQPVVVPAEAGTSHPCPSSFLRRLEPRSPSPVVPAEAGTSQPCPSSFQRRLESRGRGSLALNKVANRPRNLAPSIAGPRVNRTTDLATLATLMQGVSKAVACFPRLRRQGGHRIHKLGAGAIDPVYSWAGSYRRGLWVLPRATVMQPAYAIAPRPRKWQVSHDDDVYYPSFQRRLESSRAAQTRACAVSARGRAGGGCGRACVMLSAAEASLGAGSQWTGVPGDDWRFVVAIARSRWTIARSRWTIARGGRLLILGRRLAVRGEPVEPRCVCRLQPSASTDGPHE